MSGSSTEELTFNGVGGLTCEAFLKGVRRRAIDDGKHGDDFWMVRFAAASLDGSALRWYENLDEETQDDWRLLRRAMLARWPSDRQTQPAPAAAPSSAPPQAARAASMPTPAAAPPQSVPAAAAAAAAFPQSSTRRGRVRVLYSGNTLFGYISRNVDSEGDFTAVPNISDAAVVEIVPLSDSPAALKFTTSSPAGEYFGFQWGSRMDVESELRKSTPCWGTLVSVKLSSDLQRSTLTRAATTPHVGDYRASIWTVGSDGSISIIWKCAYANGAQYNLVPMVILSGTYRGGLMVGNFNHIRDAAIVDHYQVSRVHLVFEPV